MPSNLIIGSSIENSGDLRQLRAYYEDQWENFTGGGTSEIEEEPAASPAVDRVLVSKRGELKIPLPAIREAAEEERPSAASIDFGAGGEDAVYVAVGRHGGGGDEEASMGAVIWAIKNEAFGPSSVVFLVHVFPEAKFVPTPLGNLPISQVNKEQRELYLAKERGKRREFLDKFLNVCSASKVNVDTILIESEMEAKAILDLIPILNIRRLILGATKSTVRRMMRSRKGNGVADQIRQGAPEYCEVKIICEGKEITELETGSTSSSTSPSPRSTRGSISSPKFGRGQEKTELDSASCGCFKM
ncbi:U-box domain-containing protein kinase family protein [Striga asiatica]|uniref:U-box domain-containing protein kinase family protein n=1 Tax=Striga asiatica TaxID=4170 RepID=A0A5A7PY37_STRAF|nr:U-box domain-containing protein kinase family protein [Striga asiatica]